MTSITITPTTHPEVMGRICDTRPSLSLNAPPSAYKLIIVGRNCDAMTFVAALNIPP